MNLDLIYYCTTRLEEAAILVDLTVLAMVILNRNLKQFDTLLTWEK